MEPTSKNTRKEGAAGQPSAGTPPPPMIDLSQASVTVAERGHNPERHFNMLPQRTAESQRGGGDAAHGGLGTALVRVVDVAVHAISDAPTLSRLRQLMERSVITEEERRSSLPTSGFWRAYTEREIKELFEIKGAQALLAVDQAGTLLGAYLYQLGGGSSNGPVTPDTFASTDRKLVEAVLASSDSPIPRGEHFGVGELVVVDKRLVAELQEFHGDAPRRREILTAFHAALIHELRLHGVGWMVGNVRVAPAPNSAIEAHHAMGWREIPGCEFSTKSHTAQGEVCEVRYQALALDVNAAQHDALIDRAHQLSGIQFLDLDPQPPNPDELTK